MFATATLTSKGQTTIPVKVRRSMGIKQGDQIIFRELSEDSFEVQRVKSLAERLDEVRPYIDPEILARNSKRTVREMLENFGEDF